MTDETSDVGSASMCSLAVRQNASPVRSSTALTSDSLSGKWR